MRLDSDPFDRLELYLKCKSPFKVTNTDINLSALQFSIPSNEKNLFDQG